MSNRPLDFAEAKLYAVRRLSAMAYTSYALKALMLRKGFSSDTVDAVILHLKEAKILNDAQYLTLFLEGQKQKKMEGPLKVIAKLRAKGFSSAEITKKLNKESFDEETSISALLAKKWLLSDFSDPKVRSKVIRGLLSRGFSYSAIFNVLERGKFVN